MVVYGGRDAQPNPVELDRRRLQLGADEDLVEIGVEATARH